MERIHAAIGKGNSDTPTIFGSDGRGTKDSSGTEEGGGSSFIHENLFPLVHTFLRNHYVHAPS